LLMNTVRPSIVGLLRLRSQQIASARFPQPEAIVAWLGAMQGQDYAGVKWSVGLRLPGSTDADVERAINDTRLVRSWVMRGTLHLMAGMDVRWIVALVGPRLIAQSAARHKELDLDTAILHRSHEVLGTALQGHRRLRRSELFAVLEQQGISTQGQRGYHILRHASLDGLLVQGISEREDPTFMLLEEAFPNALPLAREDALAELARRYFQSHGPATLKDFAWWLGLSMGDARAGLDAAKSGLIEETIEGKPPQSHAAPADLEAVALAPPGFDEFHLGYQDRDAVLDPQHATKVCPGKNGVFFPTIVVGGRMVGTWKRMLKAGKAVVTPAPFEALTRAQQQAFDTSIQRYGEFLQLPVMVTAMT
jgi:hypothetical protein